MAVAGSKTNKHNAAGCDPCREEFKEHAGDSVQDVRIFVCNSAG
jgi:hypothetical protein